MTRLRVALLAVAASVVVALVATTVVVVSARARQAGPASDVSTGCSAMTVPVRHQVNPGTRTGLLTTSPAAAAAAAHAGWTGDDGILFRAAARPAAGLVAVHQLRKGTGDQLWTTDAAEVRRAAQGWGYVDQGVVAYVSLVAGPCTVQVQRFRSRGVHRYATTMPQGDSLREAGWTPEGSFYAAGPAEGATTPSTTSTSTPRPRRTSERQPAPAPGPETVIDAHFDDVPSGPVSPGSFIRAVRATNRDAASYDSMTYVKQADASGSRFVRTHLAARRILDRNDARGDGNVLVVPLEDQGRDAACVSYDVRFSPGFEVSAGGKLPGLLGVAPGVPPQAPTGAGSTKHGWSGRVMWLGPKLFRVVRESGQADLAVTYLYHAGQGGTFGDHISWGRGLIDGGWHQVRQCYDLNTLGRADGRLRAWVDGAQVLDRSDIVYRTDPKVHITHLDWSVFRGGDSADWAARTAGEIDLDNLQVTVG